MGAYQIRFLERVPKRAVVDDAVELTKAARKRSAAGFVNAVLRKCEPPKDRVLGRDFEHLSAENRESVRRAFPAWLLKRWEGDCRDHERTRRGGSAATGPCQPSTPRTTLRVVDAGANCAGHSQGVGSGGRRHIALPVRRGTRTDGGIRAGSKYPGVPGRARGDSGRGFATGGRTRVAGARAACSGPLRRAGNEGGATRADAGSRERWWPATAAPRACAPWPNSCRSGFRRRFACRWCDWTPRASFRSGRSLIGSCWTRPVRARGRWRATRKSNGGFIRRTSTRLAELQAMMLRNALAGPGERRPLGLCHLLARTGGKRRGGGEGPE